MSFLPPVVGCLFKTLLTKGGSRAPQDTPPPWLRPWKVMPEQNYLTPFFVCFLLRSVNDALALLWPLKFKLRPQLYGLGQSRQPQPPRKAIAVSKVFMWKRSTCRPSQSWPCFIIHNLFWIIKCAYISLLLWVSLDRLITVGIDESVFTYLTRISALNPKSRHYVTLTTSGVVPVRRTKAIIYDEKLSRLSGLPYLPRRDKPRIRVVSPPEMGLPFCKEMS